MVRPALFDSWLRALDVAFFSFFSLVRPVAPSSRSTPRAQKACCALQATTALGDPFGSLDHIDAQVRKAEESSGELRQAILSVDHAPTEVVLTRQCADVSKLTHHLRLNGHKVASSMPAIFDSQLRFAIGVSLIGDLPDHSWWQATTGVLFGGLGFRAAQSVALPAFIASRLVSHPLVRNLLEHFCMATGAPLLLLQRACDKHTEDAVLSLISTLCPIPGHCLFGSWIREWPSAISCGAPSATARRPHPLTPRPFFENRGITPEDGLCASANSAARMSTTPGSGN